MQQKALLNIVATRDLIPDLTTEAFLASRDGVLGVMGLQRIAESHAEVTKARDQALADASKWYKALENGVRMLDQMPNGTAVTPAQVDALVQRLAATVALDPDERPDGIQEPGDNEPGNPPASGPGNLSNPNPG